MQNPVSVSVPVAYPGYMQLASASAAAAQGGYNQHHQHHHHPGGPSQSQQHTHAGSNHSSRRGSLEYGGAGSDHSHHSRSASGSAGDGASVGTGSVPSSAASSAVHLPLRGHGHTHPHQHPQQHHGGYGPPGGPSSNVNAPYNYVGNLPDRTHTASTSSTSSSQQQGYDRYAPHDERQEFSSAFGLMSLDDPNVLAGLANDGQPFFSDPSQSHNQPQQMQQEGADVDTPMPMKRNSGQLQFPPLVEQQRPSTAGGMPSSSMLGMGGMGTPSKDADARELKEFWKQYMRTPLSGPGPAGVEGGMNFPNNSNASPSKGTPLGFRRQRVASLPSAKTPMLEVHSFMQGGYGQNPTYQQHQQRQQGSSKLGPMSSMRTTLHGNVEDLRSYEAAVLARKAPTTLNIQLRRPNKSRASASPQTHFAPRPASAVDSPNPPTSSLAHAFGGNQSSPAPPSKHPPNSAPVGRVAFVAKSEDSSSPGLSSRQSSTDPDGHSGQSEGESLRPSFKRLPSQTLGPAHAKRAFHGYTDDVEDRERAAGWGPGVPDSAPVESGAGMSPKVGGMAGMSHPDRVVASIAERRRRRMSAPSTSIPPNFDLSQGQSQDQDMNIERSTNQDVSALGYAPAGQGGG
ncbi:unnamed protein product [Cyclocybe aegerita]|uniref:Uncharacterized protein n=1 Tax=Cyclocybe aegerita TaxID=1973307 RepID=A0A8S0VWY4_CYCAE|nr:unnamed protein product [Cyclocybe aegerita]